MTVYILFYKHKYFVKNNADVFVYINSPVMFRLFSCFGKRTLFRSFTAFIAYFKKMKKK